MVAIAAARSLRSIDLLKVVVEDNERLAKVLVKPWIDLRHDRPELVRSEIGRQRLDRLDVVHHLGTTVGCTLRWGQTNQRPWFIADNLYQTKGTEMSNYWLFLN